VRIRFLVDGFNVYHSLKEAGRDLDSKNGTTGCKGTRWLSLPRLCSEFVKARTPGGTVEKVQYFSAHATHLMTSSPDTVERHKIYIACLEAHGVEAVLGRFKPAGRHGMSRHEEKETDVAIAVHMMAAFALDECDMAVLVSGDTDLAPAIRVARATFPDKRIGVLFPYRRHNRELGQLANVTMKSSPGLYKMCQLPDPCVTFDGAQFRKPATW